MTDEDKYSEDDASLWQEMTKDVKPLEGKSMKMPPHERPKRQKEDIRAKPRKSSEPAQPQTSRPKKARTGTDLDKRTDERLRRGQMPIEAQLDLHGMTQDEAYAALGPFILCSYEQGKRCVLVITGKGKTGPGILKKRVPEWLTDTDLQPAILKTYPAKPKDGGAGALYVYLRRQRD